MKKMMFIFVGVFVIVSACIGYKISTISPQKVHLHANVLIVRDGKIQDYSDTKYMELEPCSLDERHGFFDPEERAHLHNNIGTVVHVHAPGVTWGEFLRTIGIDGAGASYVVNGVQESRADLRPIQSAERMLVIFGTSPQSLEEMIAQIPQDAPEYTSGAKGVESCSSSEEEETYTLWQRLRIAFGI